jgi:hypothetical protein
VLYLKNVPPAERVIRIVMGIMLLGGALRGLGPHAAGWIVGLMGLMATLTGLVGWCPMCALAGRKPAAKS